MTQNPKPKAVNDIQQNANPVEFIKDNSDYLRGTIAQGLQNPLTGAMFDDDTMLIKFHGIYQQDDRDTRKQRMQRLLEPAYAFMIRLRLPGGLMTAKQWLVADTIAAQQTIKTLKLTTRQAMQFHGILKRNLAPTIQQYHQQLLDSIAGCGDVNRNVMCSPNPFESKAHQHIYDMAGKISKHLMPTSRAYHEIFLQGTLLAGGAETVEPLYGKHYLPRKFKIAIAIPPNNDVDVFANDIGLIAIVKKGVLLGYNVAIGGGMGMTHGDTTTYPRLGSMIGFIEADKVLDVCYHIVQIQRDYGNRVTRKHARFKYTIETYGLEWIQQELETRLGYSFSPPQSYVFNTNADVLGWQKGTNGKLFLTLHIEGGRVKDTQAYPLKTALRDIAAQDICDFRLTGNQNLILGNVDIQHKRTVLQILSKYGILDKQENLSGMRSHSIACVALNTCSLAMAEAERFLPSLIDRIEVLLDKYKLRQNNITIRMTGCPNGCGRPYLAEIGFVGKALNRYNMYLGAGHVGDRLNKLYKENIHEKDIETILEPLLADYAEHKQQQETFGDFVIRQGYVAATQHGTDFHAQIKA